MKTAATSKPSGNTKPSRFCRFLLWTAALGLVFAMVFLGVTNSYRWFKRFQAGRMAQMATSYADQGKVQEAIMSADTALHLDPAQPVALRFMAELYESDGRNNQAMELYARLYQSGSGTLEDLKKQALNAIRAGYLDPAQYLAKDVAEKGEPDFPMVVEAEIKLRNGENANALELLHEAVSLYGGRSSRLAYLRLLLATPNAENRNLEIGRQLTNLKDGDDAASLEALVWGISTAILPPEKRLSWIPFIRQHPKVRFPILLLANRFEVELDPASKNRVARELVQQASGRPLQDRLQAAQWLTRIGKAREAAEILPLKDAITQAEAMRSWVDLAAAMGEWKTLRDALALPTNPLPAHMSKIYTARALKMSGMNSEGDALYRAALEEYKDKPSEIVEILEYLHRSGEYELFDTAMPYQLQKTDQAMSIMSRLVPVVADARDSLRMRRLFQMAESAPATKDNNFILNDAAYLDLVLGLGTDTTALEKRFQNFPSDPAVRFTLALAKLLGGDREAALTLVKESQIPPQNLAPNQLVVLSTVLAANHSPEKAIAVARLIPAARISKQELDLLKSRLITEPNPEKKR